MKHCPSKAGQTKLDAMKFQLINAKQQIWNGINQHNILLDLIHRLRDLNRQIIQLSPLCDSSGLSLLQEMQRELSNNTIYNLRVSDNPKKRKPGDSSNPNKRQRTR